MTMTMTMTMYMVVVVHVPLACKMHHSAFPTAPHRCSMPVVPCISMQGAATSRVMSPGWAAMPPPSSYSSYPVPSAPPADTRYHHPGVQYHHQLHHPPARPSVCVASSSPPPPSVARRSHQLSLITTSLGSRVRPSIRLLLVHRRGASRCPARRGPISIRRGPISTHRYPISTRRDRDLRLATSPS